MSLPQPKVALTGICSVIYNNTLYTYSSSAFQSLSLTSGSKWKQLASGESVTGGVCVGSTPSDSTQAGFYVVGGNGTTTGYNGIQKYTYATGNWSTVALETPVTQQRLYHGATYINDTDTILIYGGSQDGTKAYSTQTFTIQASAPYGVLAYQSIAPPTINPILLPWSTSQAVMIGGSTTNNKVMLFSTASGWTDSGTTLATPLQKDISSIQAAIIVGDDNSKNLYTFDATQSPNQVNRTVLMDADGKSLTNSAPVKRSIEETPRRWSGAPKRRATGSLTLSDWPTYNSTLAPTVTRSGYSLAQGWNGMVVLAGGTTNDVLCVFNGWTNQWRNATQMLVNQKSLLQSSTASVSSTVPSSTLDASPSSTSAPTATSATSTPSTTTAAAVAAAKSGSSTNVILAAALGSVAGLGIILLVIYLLIRRSKKRKNYADAAHDRRASGTTSSEKDAYAIVNESYMQGPNGKSNFRGGHQAQDSQGSFSSVAILMGRVNQQKPIATVQRNDSKDTKRSSVSSVFNKGLKGTISKPIPQATPQVNLTAAAAIPQSATFERVGPSTYGRSIAEPRPQNGQAPRQGSTRRSSGWNRYWSGGSALNLLGFGNGQGNGNGGNNNNNNNNNNPNGRQSMRATLISDVSSSYSADQHRITQDSATVPPLDIPSMPDSKPHFNRVNSGSPTIASYDKYMKDGLQGKIERQESRSSSHSAYSSGIPASVHDAWDPTSNKAWGSDRAPSSAYSSAYNSTVYGTSLAPASAPSAGTKKQYVPTGMSSQPQLAMANTSSDMSWLNLGDVSRV